MVEYFHIKVVYNNFYKECEKFYKESSPDNLMQERLKAQITVGILAYFASVWILYEQAKSYPVLLDSIILVVVLLIAMLVISYVIIAILEWINIFELKTNAILTLIVLTAFTINLTIYLINT